METGRDGAKEAARRSLAAALSYFENGNYKTAGSLFRAGCRYLERSRDEASTALVIAGSPLIAHELGWGSSGSARDC